MNRLLAAATMVAAPLLIGADQPRALRLASGGLWEISGLPGRAQPVRRCLGNLSLLAQIEHGGQACSQTVVEDGASAAVVHYRCAAGGFGQTRMTLITPRALRVETQGIADKLPFNYVVQARRMGDCPAH